MVTSRTGTILYKKMRKIAFDRAIAEQQTNCPLCGVWLDYQTHGKPYSPEADEIIPHAVSGHTSDDPNNWRIICRRCNGKLGGQLGQARQKFSSRTGETIPDW